MKQILLLFSTCLLTAWGSEAPKPDAVVAADGTGDYTSVQEAISRAPMRTGLDDPRWVILVKPGAYRERIHVQRERGNMLVRGEDAEKTVIVFNLRANLPGGAFRRCSWRPRLPAAHRSKAGADSKRARFRARLHAL